MNAESISSAVPLIDRDDVQEMTDDFIGKGVWKINEELVSQAQAQGAMKEATRRGRPMGSVKDDSKQAVTIRYSPDVLQAFRESGPGWQGRMNEALRQWLQVHKAELSS